MARAFDADFRHPIVSPLRAWRKRLMVFPNGFPNSAQSRVTAAKVLADERLENELKNRMPPPSYTRREQLLAAARSYILQIFSVFGKEACELGKDHIWTTVRVEREAEQFLREIAIGLRSDYSHAGLPDMLSSWGVIDPVVLSDLKASPEWRIFRANLLAVAEAQAEAGRGVPQGLFSSSLSERLDEISSREGKSHEDIAHMIKVSRSSYFAVKANKGGRKVRTLVQRFVDQWFQQHNR